MRMNPHHRPSVASVLLLLLVLFVLFQVCGTSGGTGGVSAQIVDGGNCSTILTTQGGNPGMATVCRVFPNRDLMNNTCPTPCAEVGGVCFREGFCCPRGWDICGIGFATISACFDPLRVSCCGIFSSPGGTAPVLCDAPTPNRQRACVFPGAFSRPSCTPTNPNLLPPPIRNVCGPNNQVFDPTQYVCLQGAVLCPRSAPLACGTQCFDPTRYVCVSRLEFTPEFAGVQRFQLCPLFTPDSTATTTPGGAPFLCGIACYNRARYTCLSARRVETNNTDILLPVPTPTPIASAATNAMADIFEDA